MARYCRFLLILLTGAFERCPADDFISAPSPNPPEGATYYPFLLNQMLVPVPSMRYQQVYSSSLFTNADPASIYVCTLKLQGAALELGTGTGVSNMQINFSTTSKGADALSPVFSQNVGPDDTKVFGPASCDFSGGISRFPELILLDRPFRYDPTAGNLLLDIRIFDSSGFLDIRHRMWNVAYNSPTDGVSRVWATNVTAAVADGSDSTGLFTVIQLSPVPSLRAEFFPLYAGALTNTILITWPSQPSTFVLQRTDRLGPNASWHAATEQILGTPRDPLRAIMLSADSAGSMGYYRLVWPGGP